MPTPFKAVNSYHTFNGGGRYCAKERSRKQPEEDMKHHSLTGSGYQKKVYNGHLEHGEDNGICYDTLEPFLTYWKQWVTNITPRRPPFIFIN